MNSKSLKSKIDISSMRDQEVAIKAIMCLAAEEDTTKAIEVVEIEEIEEAIEEEVVEVTTIRVAIKAVTHNTVTILPTPTMKETVKEDRGRIDQAVEATTGLTTKTEDS